MSSSSSATQFLVDELRRALTEQLFGIQTFTITSTNSVHAAACVALLEGSEITVDLSVAGFTVRGSYEILTSYLIMCTKIEASKTVQPLGYRKDAVFESIENLLQSVSPEYEKKRHEYWVKKLEAFSQED